MNPECLTKSGTGVSSELCRSRCPSDPVLPPPLGLEPRLSPGLAGRASQSLSSRWGLDHRSGTVREELRAEEGRGSCPEDVEPGARIASVETELLGPTVHLSLRVF